MESVVWRVKIGGIKWGANVCLELGYKKSKER